MEPIIPVLSVKKTENSLKESVFRSQWNYDPRGGGTPILPDKDTPESGRSRTMLDSIKTIIGKHTNFRD
jgi:hypothetical protein